MVLNVRDMISKPLSSPGFSPLGAAVAGFGEGLIQGTQEKEQLAMRKAQLEQQKMQFEQQMKMQQAQHDLQRQRMAYDMAEADRMKELQKLAAKKKDDEERLGLSTKYTQTLLGGDRVGADAMRPEMEARGMMLVKEGEENGIPRMRVYQNKEERAKEDQEYARRINMARASDIRPEDVTIPRGGTLIDAPAAEATRRAELGNVLGRQLEAYPEGEPREIARASSEAALSVPGSTADRLKAYDSLVSGPMQNYRGEQAGKSQVNAAREQRAGNTEARNERKTDYEMREIGTKQAKEAGANIDLDKYREQYDSLKLSAEALRSNTPTDHQIAGRNLARVLANEKGPMSNQDISGILGNDSESFIDRIKKGAYKEAFGGMAPDKRDALIKLAEKKLGAMQANLYAYMDRIEDDASTEKDPEVAEGMRRYVERNVDKTERETWGAQRKAKQPPPAEQPQGSLTGDPDPNGPLRIDALEGRAFDNNNPGNLRYAKQDGATENDGFAKFPTREAGYNALVKQVKLDQGRGLTLTEFANKYAPPEENDTEQWMETVSEKTGLKPGDKIDSMDPDTLARAIAFAESGALIVGKVGGVASPGYVPKNDTEARLIELFGKGG